MEGFPRHLEHAELLNNAPFTCGNIFNHFHLAARKKIKIYVHCYIKDSKSRNHILCPSVDMEVNLKELEGGVFHMLLLVHKFPVQQKVCFIIELIAIASNFLKIQAQNNFSFQVIQAYMLRP